MQISDKKKLNPLFSIAKTTVLLEHVVFLEMNKGINKAIGSQARKLIFESDEIRNRPSVFLSHKIVDKPKCREIAAYLSQAGIHYYLDEEDDALQQADREKNAIAITEAIKKGIRESTHMLVVVSLETFNSPWIPFEVGYGHSAILGNSLVNRSIKLGVLTTLEVSETPLPDFLGIAYPVRGTKSLNEYISKVLGTNESRLIAETRLFSNNKMSHQLDNVLNWKL